MSEEKVNLKPCPFCGGEAEIERSGTPRVSTIYACTNCGCRLETGETFNHGGLWNDRFDENKYEAALVQIHKAYFDIADPVHLTLSEAYRALDEAIINSMPSELREYLIKAVERRNKKL